MNDNECEYEVTGFLSGFGWCSWLGVLWGLASVHIGLPGLKWQPKRWRCPRISKMDEHGMVCESISEAQSTRIKQTNKHHEVICLGMAARWLERSRLLILTRLPSAFFKKTMAFCFCACFVRWFFSGKIGIYGFVVLLMAITSWGNGSWNPMNRQGF